MRKNKTFSVMVEIRSGKASLNASYSMLFSVTQVSAIYCYTADTCKSADFKSPRVLSKRSLKIG